MLYPTTENDLVEVATVATLAEQPQPIQILVLDGTWRKTYKLLQLNPRLAELPRIQLAPQQASKYRIRKQKNALSLSTLEAVGQLLTQLEKAPQIAEDLERAFDCFQSAIFSYPLRP
ncbi:hypothetical protein THMIRHAS_19740 [Thiosulfatimonas sediminis]|uniref:tRNA-uridine aminocarboxypropyltransferase n=1 Tax=Thiosulfatimonas sediminis TaxID=2675054 RepID=A0A6F8PWV1_9GAMM|nr:hypothetical protein THMIRHAS_19740 [Thiosulfatimonas sediminis]